MSEVGLADEAIYEYRLSSSRDVLRLLKDIVHLLHTSLLVKSEPDPAIAVCHHLIL